MIIPQTSDLENAVAQIVADFSLKDSDILSIAAEFNKEMNLGLGTTNHPAAMNMIPAFVTAIPNGTETGTYLAVDLGGTNFRVCSVDLKGDSTFELLQSKYPVPRELMISTSHELFSFMAHRIREFLITHHSDKYAEDNPISHTFKLGFTFSFPVAQVSLNHGNLLRWTKGFDIPDAIGMDVPSLLQEEIDKLSIPVHVSALVNDTVGTLMSRSYTSAGTNIAVIGAIFGTGTNGAYLERISRITKLDSESVASTDEYMVVNTEWGGFDNDLKVLPSTKYDNQLDQLSPNPGYQMFEKRISGMFLGELLRLVLVDLRKSGLILKSKGTDDFEKAVSTPWAIDTSVLSKIEADNTLDMIHVQEVLAKLGYEADIPKNERISLHAVVSAIGRRAGYLSGIAIGSTLKHIDAFGDAENPRDVDVGVDGSVVEYYPGFEALMRKAISLIVGQKSEGKLSIGIARDGSGVGAALCAASAK
ncbi:hypothetical protein CANCADRAFT_43637 [Tortispora caseinolytica NRRL Y-17796]|uniref:Phosphotransferase n=1 Tax=Tortispora caseinolytica NRRL Y-17796 TaxID=767744 RepID=A0A1E4TDU4_9ASCO|nr:hypothetical protein CANCADRAFT_43637 [Tortispora caseinolytica NRRL Y-17796]